MHPWSRFLAVALPVNAAAAIPSPGVYTTSYVANSFFGNLGTQNVQSVPDFIGNGSLCYNGAGKITVGGTSENYGGGFTVNASDGSWVQRHYTGIRYGAHTQIASNATQFYFGCSDGLRRQLFSERTPSASWLAGKYISGVALHDSELYVANMTDQAIQVFRLPDMSQVRSWAATRPGPMAVDKNGKLWVVQGQPDYGTAYSWAHDMGGERIVSYSGSGVRGDSITGFPSPIAVAVDSRNELLVGGYNAQGQIWKYGNLSGTPAKTGAIGAPGGMFSGTPGLDSAGKFFWITGLAVDENDDVYVGERLGSWWGCRVQKCSPTGARKWMLLCGAPMLDVGAIDPADGMTVYDKEMSFTLDWGEGWGREWTLKAFTYNPFKYTDDPRLDWNHGPTHRLATRVIRIAGKKFLVCTNQGGSNPEFYRFTDGEVAVPSVWYSTASISRPGAGSAWPGDAEFWIWRDLNGDGLREADEYSDVAKDPSTYEACAVASDGSIWYIGWSNLYYQPCEGLDAAGNPIYHRKSLVGYGTPPEWTPSGHPQPYRAYYDADDSALYIGGSAAGDGEQLNWHRIIRYDHWLQGNRAKKWEATVPVNDTAYTWTTNYGAGKPLNFSTAGDYVFIGYGIGEVRILRKADGSLVGTLYPYHSNPDLDWSGGGQVDAAWGLTAYKRANGEYIVMSENGGYGNISMYRWTPASTTNMSPGHPPRASRADAHASAFFDFLGRRAGPGQAVKAKRPAPEAPR